MFTENDVVKFVAQKLEKPGYTVESQLTTIKKGIDIVALRGSKRLFIEVQPARSKLR
jgi:Holliday junction resolvase-like predicted endonuclease